LALPRLAAAPDLVGASRALEEGLLARLPAVGVPDRRIAHAVRALFGRRPPSVAALADGFGVSRQHLTRAFRQEVGLGPKELARVARAQRALALAQQRRANLAAVAAHAGYYDEAHMDRDFRALIGMTPAKAQAAAGSIRPILSLLDEA
jgi:AraC-like DNA-binding protein